VGTAEDSWAELSSRNKLRTMYNTDCNWEKSRNKKADYEAAKALAVRS
jgi:hypothetical protein